LVANSVEGLQVNNVSVVDNMGNVLSQNDDNDSVAGLSNNQLTARRNFELYLSKKAEGMLEKVLGPGQAVVRVSAEINWDTTTRTEEKFDPDGQVARTTTVNDEDTDTSTVTTGGAPGAAANAAANPDDGTASTNAPVAATPVNSSRTRKKVTNSSYEINKITSNVIEAAGGLKRLSTAVFVAQRVEGEGAARKIVPRTSAEVEALKRIVQSALGLQITGDSARQDEIVLEEMPFNDQPVRELNQQLDQQEKRRVWLDLAQKLIYPSLALGVIFAFWRMFQKAKAEEIRLGVPLANGRASGNGNGKPALPGKGVVTVEVLNQLIRENPANMTQAVRSWLGRAKNEN
ncbi:MAG: flagellar M-ring protein FliF C-terminal domain-containing protein, partial [Candidatus Aminicenantales bacterium]